MSITQRPNPMAVRSREALLNAATDLLGDLDASEITVTDVTKAAGVSRPTFYEHAGDLASLFSDAGLAKLNALAAPVVAQLRTTLESGADTSDAPIEAALHELIARLQEDGEFFSRVEEGPGGHAIHQGAIESTIELLQAVPTLQWHNHDDTAVWQFLAAGTMWIITRHLEAYCADPNNPALQPVANLMRILRALNAAHYGTAH